MFRVRECRARLSCVGAVCLSWGPAFARGLGWGEGAVRGAVRGCRVWLSCVGVVRGCRADGRWCGACLSGISALRVYRASCVRAVHVCHACLSCVCVLSIILVRRAPNAKNFL
ncbi:MAG: hypothetical protein GY820_16015 [Gammaproteobacteria bacterium]|nr:hypothetical protein [Gammaproteobacteria bacterium]